MSTAREISEELHAEELARLRSERDQAIADLRATERENDILRSINVGVGPNVGYKFARAPEVDKVALARKADRLAMLEHAVRAMDAALFDISRRYDCYDRDRDKDGRCDCPICMAKEALLVVEAWRYSGSGDLPADRFAGAKAGRITSGHHPREEKIHAAWAAWADDFKLASILDDHRPAPSARDWYVATSIVQWLATNVGMEILEAAGFEYKHFAEDYANRMKKTNL